ncbi:hypothetical protein H4R34_004048 [Dimargaris verticillata]|uniref:Protein-L-isoaspartate O-methyltransferase n=1 Tax=Dimargaris verticillata TaxID=2761393 RepID=A0A9W8E7M2_9FUNG|nr:hypothetical protein H4R34_004048 [Dimargaris verticillata]
MAWRCTGKSNDELVSNLKASGIVKNPRVEQALRAVDRRFYCPEEPYIDSPGFIGSNATISAPHMHASALEHLEPYLQPGMHGLDVGSGSGYLAACMAELVGSQGTIVGIDHIDALVEASKHNLNRDKMSYLESGRVQLAVADGRQGYPFQAPYDCIHVGAACSERPNALINQLKAPGRMFAPVGSVFAQQIIQYDKAADGKVTETPLMEVRYVPLTDAAKQLG